MISHPAAVTSTFSKNISPIPTQTARVRLSVPLPHEASHPGSVVMVPPPESHGVFIVAATDLTLSRCYLALLIMFFMYISCLSK